MRMLLNLWKNVMILVCVCSASLEAVSPNPRNNVPITPSFHLYLHVQFTHGTGALCESLKHEEPGSMMYR